MMTKDGRDTAIAGLTPQNYIVPKGEEMSYHCVIEVTQFDPKTGKRLSVPWGQKFGKKMFETNVRDTLRKQGFTVTILHNPTEWLEKHKAELEERAKEQAEARAKAEKQKFDDAVAAAVAKELAKMEKKPGRPAKPE